MIQIKLVRVGNMLVGQTVSDRWNLMQMDMGDGIPYDRNQSGLKRLRRLWEGFSIQVVRQGQIITAMSPSERQAFSGPSTSSIAC
jgi:hypothetical protein